MKKTICLIMTMLLVIFVGCQKGDRTNPDSTLTTILNEGTFINDIPSDNISLGVEYVIYAGSSSGEIIGFADAKDNVSSVSFGSLSERDFSYASRIEITNEDAEEEKTVTLGESEFKGNYVRSFSNPLAYSADENLHALGYFDEYRSEENGNRFTVQFRQIDDELVFFSAVDGRSVVGTLTKQEAKTLADSFLAEKYGDQFVIEYPNCEIITTNDESNKIITVCYTKYIYGYPTTDRVLVTYNMSGEMKAFNAKTKDLFDSIESSITIEKITNAETALLEVIPSTWNIGAKILSLDADGCCYLHVTTAKASETIGNSVEAIEFYINLD